MSRYNPDHLSSRVQVPGDRRSVTVTFNYGGDLRTLVAPNRKEAFRLATERWGAGWDGEPVVSTPFSIYSDLIGLTRMKHGQDLNQKEHTARARDRYRRTGQSYRAKPADTSARERDHDDSDDA